MVTALVTAVPALAAESFAQIAALRGKVLVSKGKGFEPATTETHLNIGDRVLISDKSAVTISFRQAGCQATLEKPAVFKVSKSVPCGGELILNTASGAPIVAPVAGAFGLGAGAAVGVPAVGWGVAMFITPIKAASSP